MARLKKIWPMRWEGCHAHIAGAAERALDRLYSGRAGHRLVAPRFPLLVDLNPRGDPARRVWRLGGDRHPRSDPKPTRRLAQLSVDRTHPLHPGRNPPGDPAVFSRERKGRHTVL